MPRAPEGDLVKRLREALDESEQRRRELTLRLDRNRARLTESQVLAHVGSWETHVASGRVSWSEETHRIFETDPAVFQPTHDAFLQFVHPDDRSAVDAAFQRSVGECSDADSIEHRLLFADGRIKLVLERWRVFRDEQGAPLRAVGTCQDITERRRGEENLRESEERFRQLAENIGEVFWITDVAKSAVVYISPGYEVVWGRKCEELYRDPASWLTAIHPDDCAAIVSALAKQAAGEYDETYRIVRPDGALRWIHDRAFPVRNDAGEIYRIVGIAEDITERKQIEEQLLRAQRMESIGTLAGGIAHDLNNMLTPILMSVALLREPGNEDLRDELLSSIEASAKRGASMVRQVLTFARGVEGLRISVSVPALLREVEKIATDTFLKTLTVRCLLPPALPAVTGDPTQLHQVLINLCVNARDAMPDGGTLTLSAEEAVLDAQYVGLHPEAREGRHVVIHVEDTGSGMSQSVVERIFEPFFTTKEVGGGTGLGLSTSLAIVKSHGGFVRVHSVLGRGSKLSLHLPARNEGEGVGEADAGRAELPRGNGELILVVDDEEAVRAVTKRTLEAFGYRVLLAGDGAEALALYAPSKSEIAAVVTDMMMPILDGPATIRVLRKLEPRVQIIAVSGMTDVASVARYTSAGVDAILPKPYTTEKLLGTLAEVLRRPV